MNKALEIINLNKSYSSTGNKKVVNALKNVSFSVEKGSMLAFLGPNGAGKSTLINILAGIVNKSSGKILINGYNVDTQERASKLSIGVVPQEIVVDPFFTPRETLDFQSGYYGIRKKYRKTNALLKRLKLDEKSDAYVRHLSGGMKRRLMIAKAMVHSPPILILDEPTAGVDVSLRQLLWDNIKELNKKGTTILITTHYLEEAESLCDDVAIIDKGNIVVNGNIKALVNSIDRKKMYIKSSKVIDILPTRLSAKGFSLKDKLVLEIEYSPTKYSAGNLIELVNQENIVIQDVTTEEPTLEDLFKKIIG